MLVVAKWWDLACHCLLNRLHIGNHSRAIDWHHSRHPNSPFPPKLGTQNLCLSQILRCRFVCKIWCRCMTSHHPLQNGMLKFSNHVTTSNLTFCESKSRFFTLLDLEWFEKKNNLLVYFSLSIEICLAYIFGLVQWSHLWTTQNLWHRVWQLNIQIVNRPWGTHLFGRLMSRMLWNNVFAFIYVEFCALLENADIAELFKLCCVLIINSLSY